jgi:hypothetical protein
VSDHLPRHHLERLIADDPRLSVRPELQMHLASCHQCATRKRLLEAATARFLSVHPATDFVRAVLARATAPGPVQRRAPRVWKARPMLAAGLGLLAAAAAVLSLDRMPGTPDIRLKGGVALQAIAMHGGTTRPLRDGDALSVGDQIAFEYALDRPRHLLLLGIDDEASVTRYFPVDGSRATPLGATRRAQLPIGIQLDAHRGEERLYALFSETALDERAVRAALARALAAQTQRGGGIATMEAIDVPARHVSVWFRKP